MLGGKVILVIVMFKVVMTKVEKVIFPWSLIDATIEDGYIRKRRVVFNK